MSDFLNFLNTADLDTLIEITGITHPIAENIIAARPFDFVEDCLKVRGVGKNMLARMMSAFEAGENASENRAMIQVEEDAMPALIEKSQPAQESVEEKPSFLSRLGRAFVNFLRALLRLIITLVFIAGIGAVIYFGMPFINETFIVPVEQNTARIREIETKMATLQTQLNEMNTRVDTIEKTIEAHTAIIAELDKMQATLEEETTAQSNSVMIALKREIMFTRTIETLSRARLFFSQSNFGLAEADVQSARDILAELLIDAPPYQRDALNQIIIRLDLALGNMPVFPVIAVDDVDIAWQLMMMGLPESEADVIATFTPKPAPTFTVTPTPEPILEVTPTATP
jgi:hypothetical protein